jgi:hypothetical protein
MDVIITSDNERLVLNDTAFNEEKQFFKLWLVGCPRFEPRLARSQI